MSSRPIKSRAGMFFLVRSSLALLVAIWLSSFVAICSTEAASPHVDIVLLNTDISSSSLRFLTHAIDTAEHDGARALIVQIDTPGGDLQSMKEMTQQELASSVPIISYVSPVGGRAASAGAFVTLAAHVAAMAPTTRIGASSPVTSTGADIDSTLKAKIESDLIASITGIQERYGRNVALADLMVTQAKAYDDVAAVQNHLVDLSAPNLSALLRAVNGRSVHLSSGQVVILQTNDVSMETIGITALDSFYAFFLDPTVVFLLFIVAMIGIYLEVAHPGAILPGVTGAIALLLFLFAAGSLSPNWVGFALMLLAFVLLVLDVRLPTHGVLTIGAIISLVIGSLMFFNGTTSYGGPLINPLIIYVMGGILGLIGLALVTFLVRAQRHSITTGVEGMVGKRVTALTALLPEGRVSYAGENWAAALEPPATAADPGSELQIVRIEGLRLYVCPINTSFLINTSAVSTHEGQI